METQNTVDVADAPATASIKEPSVLKPKKPAPQKKKQTFKNNNARNSNGPSPSFSIVSATSTKTVSHRTVALNNKQLENQLMYFSRITRAIMTITGSLVRCKQFNIQREFDCYVSELIDLNIVSVTLQLAEYRDALKLHEENGYEFVQSGQPAKIKVEIRSNHTAALVDLLLLIDECISVASHLEKTTSLSTQELYSLVSQWCVIPRQIFGRLSSLMDKLDKEFRFKTGNKTNANTTKDVQFRDVFTFMQQLRSDQKKPTVTAEKEPSPTLAKQVEKSIAVKPVTSPTPEKEVKQDIPSAKFLDWDKK